MEKHKLLIIEDDEAVRLQMKWVLAAEYELLFAPDGERALSIFRAERPSLVTLDLGLPPSPAETTEGLKTLGRLLELDPLTKVIVVTGNSEKRAALDAISNGAHDYFTKPLNVDELKTILKRAWYVHSLELEHKKMQDEKAHERLDEMVGTCPAMQEVFSTVRKIATTDVPVLITGESGTGKELIARAIHSTGLRKDRPFVPINCGAIPENLLESELFGHEKGAFTGAHIQRCGRIELAQGGTLFLDEIGDLPQQLQVKILRFLQDHRIERVGGRESYQIDVRVVAATNRNIKKQILEDRFREDLYYRLAVVTLELPPLRERGDDITLIAKSMLRKYTSGSKDPKTLSSEAIDALNAYGWPGNIRELENRIRRAITFADGPVIRAADLGFGTTEVRAELDLKRAKEELEVRYVNLAILKHNGNISKAAEELGLSRPTVHSIIKKYNLLGKDKTA